MALFRFMVINEDGQRVGRFESPDLSWGAGDTFILEDTTLRIVEILPEVSTMTAYNAVWVATPATDEDGGDAVGRLPHLVSRVGRSARAVERDAERTTRL